MSKSKELKICPLHAVQDYSLMTVCKEGKCAWYDDVLKACSITSISRDLHSIVAIIEEWE